MSENGITKHDQILAGLVMSLQAATMQHLGKIQNPMTGKIERDLEQARGSIDLLDMLKTKCRQDTPEEILSMMDSAVMDLQMNFMDEMKKEEQQAKSGDGDADAPSDESTEKTDETEASTDTAAEGEEAE